LCSGETLYGPANGNSTSTFWVFVVVQGVADLMKDSVWDKVY
jgi:hypothetical protein